MFKMKKIFSFVVAGFVAIAGLTCSVHAEDFEGVSEEETPFTKEYSME